jgi:hypothetical protein
MGYERHAGIVSGTVTARLDEKTAATAPVVDASKPRRPLEVEDDDVMKQARRMRDEWRRERYARLTN